MEKITRKGETACYDQFFLFSQCFPQLYIFTASKCGIVDGNGLTAPPPLSLSLSLSLSLKPPIPTNTQTKLTYTNCKRLKKNETCEYNMSKSLPVVWCFALRKFIQKAGNKTWVRIHQLFSRTFFVFFSKICNFECNTTSDWLNRTV